MRRILIFLGVVYSSQLLAQAQSPSLEDFNRLLDFGETNFPDLLSPSTGTNRAEVIGSSWFYRDYGYLTPIQGGTGLVIAVSISGGGGFSPGDVYAIGGAYGTELVLVDTLSNLLTLVPDSPVPETTDTGEIGNGDLIIEYKAPNEIYHFLDSPNQAAYLYSESSLSEIESGNRMIPPDISISSEFSDGQSTEEFIESFRNGWFENYEDVSVVNINGYDVWVADDGRSTSPVSPELAAFVQVGGYTVVITSHYSASSYFDEVMERLNFVMRESTDD